MLEVSETKQISSLSSMSAAVHLPALQMAVLNGKPDVVERILKTHPNLLLEKCTAKDPALRTFANNSPLQNMAWSLDWRMLLKMLKYLPKEKYEEAGQQLVELETLGRDHGAHYDARLYIKGLQNYLARYQTLDYDNYPTKEKEQLLDQLWCSSVGLPQRQATAALVNEICRPDRLPSSPPDFKHDNNTQMPRTFEIYIKNGNRTSWFPLPDGLGSDFAIVWSGNGQLATGWGNRGGKWAVTLAYWDLKAVTGWYEAGIKKLQAFKNMLLNPESQNTPVSLWPESKAVLQNANVKIDEINSDLIGPDALRIFKASWEKMNKDPSDLSEIITLQQLTLLTHLFLGNDARSITDGQITFLKILNNRAVVIFEQIAGREFFSNAICNQRSHPAEIIPSQNIFNQWFKNESFVINFVMLAPECVKQLSDRLVLQLLKNHPYSLHLAWAVNQVKPSIKINPLSYYLSQVPSQLTLPQVLTNAKQLLRLKGLLNGPTSELSCLSQLIIDHEDEFSSFFAQLDQNKKGSVLLANIMGTEAEAVDILTALSSEQLNELMTIYNYNLSLCKLIMKDPALSEKINLEIIKSERYVIQNEYLLAGKKLNQIIAGRWFESRRNTMLRFFFKDHVVNPSPFETLSQAVYFGITAREHYMDILMGLAHVSWMASHETRQKEKTDLEEQLIAKSPFFRAYFKRMTLAQILIEYPGYMSNFLDHGDPDYTLMTTEVLASATWEQFHKILQLKYWSDDQIFLYAKRCLQFLNGDATIVSSQLTDNFIKIVLSNRNLLNKFLEIMPVEMLQDLPEEYLELVLSKIKNSLPADVLGAKAWVKFLSVERVKDQAKALITEESVRKIIGSENNPTIAVSLVNHPRFEPMLNQDKLALSLPILQLLYNDNKLAKCSWANLGDAYLANSQHIEALRDNPASSSFLATWENLILTQLAQESNYMLVQERQPQNYLPKILHYCWGIVDVIKSFNDNTLAHNPTLTACLVATLLTRAVISTDAVMIYKLYTKSSPTNKATFAAFAEVNFDFSLKLLLSEDYCELNNVLFKAIAKCLDNHSNRLTSKPTLLLILQRIGSDLSQYIPLLSHVFKQCDFTELRAHKKMFITLFKNPAFLESIASEPTLSHMFNAQGQLYDERLRDAIKQYPIPQKILRIEDLAQVLAILNYYPELIISGILPNLCSEYQRRVCLETGGLLHKYTLSTEDLLRIQASHRPLPIDRLAEHVNGNNPLILSLKTDIKSQTLANNLTNYLVALVKEDIDHVTTYPHLVGPYLMPAIKEDEALAALLIKLDKSLLDTLHVDLYPTIVNSLPEKLTVTSLEVATEATRDSEPALLDNVEDNRRDESVAPLIAAPQLSLSDSENTDKALLAAKEEVAVLQTTFFSKQPVAASAAIAKPTGEEQLTDNNAGNILLEGYAQQGNHY